MRCVIVGGAEIHNYDLIRSYLRSDDYIIFCDCGLRHADSLCVSPSLIIGDFDSHPMPNDTDNLIILPCVKDDTDTIFAVKESIRRGVSEVLMIGVTGGREDMTLGNICALLMLKNNGITAMIASDYSEMSIITAGETVKVSDGWRCFSLLNISGTASGITITGAKYPLDDGAITPEYQYGISNETLPGNDAVISLKEGNLLLVCVRRV